MIDIGRKYLRLGKMYTTWSGWWYDASRDQMCQTDARGQCQITVTIDALRADFRLRHSFYGAVLAWNLIAPSYGQRLTPPLSHKNIIPV